MYRTLFCNDIRDEHVGSRVQLAGWVDVVRDHGGVIFIDLRDYTGVTQVVVHNEDLLKNVNRETVISVSGKVEKRAPETVNEKIATGYVELAPCRRHVDTTLDFCFYHLCVYRHLRYLLASNSHLRTTSQGDSHPQSEWCEGYKHSRDVLP